MDLHDDAIVAPLDHERHVRRPRAARIGGDDGTEATRRRKGQSAIILDAELGAQDVHGGGARGWRETIQPG